MSSPEILEWSRQNLYFQWTPYVSLLQEVQQTNCWKTSISQKCLSSHLLHLLSFHSPTPVYQLVKATNDFHVPKSIVNSQSYFCLTCWQYLTQLITLSSLETLSSLGLQHTHLSWSSFSLSSYSFSVSFADHILLISKPWSVPRVSYLWVYTLLQYCYQVHWF